MKGELVFLLEEESAKALLESLVPRLMLPEVTIRYIAFEGKNDLEAQLTRKIRAYRNPNAKFIVMRDQDAHPDCKIVKGKLAEMCQKAGRMDALVRIACRELESFYLADLEAVELALGIKNLQRLQAKRKFRTPDALEKPSYELYRLTAGQYQKVGGSRALGHYLKIDNGRSNSFRMLVEGIKRLALLASQEEI